MHLKLQIQYDGTDFVGSQLQAKGRTVQGELEAALARLAGTQVRAALAGRTDTGVHAWAQVASLDFPERPRLDTPEQIRRALNGMLPKDLSVTSAETAPEGFHARFSARKRAYRYLLWCSTTSLPLMRRYSLQVRPPLDTPAMADAANLLVGTHDLAAFAGSGMGVPQEDDDAEGRASTVRTVFVARMHSLDPQGNFWLWDAPKPEDRSVNTQPLWALDLVANAFLPQMIRTIAGTLLEVGQGKRTVESIRDLVESRDRRKAGQTAPPQGLCLLWIEY
jgi:tRNA pseudouridine38-40 synthase